MLANKNIPSLFIIFVALVFFQGTLSNAQPSEPEIETQCAFLDVQGSYDINAALMATTTDNTRPKRIKTTKVQKQTLTWPEAEGLIKQGQQVSLAPRDTIQPTKPVRPSGLNSTIAKTARFCKGTFEEHIVCIWVGNQTRTPPLPGYKPGWYTDSAGHVIDLARLNYKTKIEVSVNGTDYKPYTVAGFCTFPIEPNVIKDCAQIVLPVPLSNGECLTLL
ncbi:uncharacterized protein MELLADRAFT_92130 [Melampsora larici-populina 98AG31]|uniref:Secreted protein n=1 Tax=Melampsora larici-populina (strain 98AG31 / pathotype 3-4-7) TaxID=747676 RepID=F4S1L7_MELLP|nr:uncharacterized protein MELLADRAFT_92130 [Melampsora larici-populina 98AG31]EGG01484.1 hypothetical protein MELLADRAFT_92130 [Melampsora larici-populina 98AG31]